MKVLLIYFLIYIIYIVIKFKELESISGSFYAFNKNLVFPVWIGLLGYFLIELNQEEPLIMLSGCGLIWVGVSAAFRKELDGKLHILSVVITVLSLIIWLIINGYIYILFIVLLLSLCIKYWSKRPILWIEVVLFLSGFISLILKEYGY